MKIKSKFIFLSPLIALPVFATISCSVVNSNAKIENLKNKLNEYIELNKQNNVFDQVKIQSNYLNNNTLCKQTNLFNCLDSIEILENVFSLTPLENVFQSTYHINYSFSNVVDSFGQVKLPKINEIKTQIVVPILITITDLTNQISVSKYVNFFTLNIIDEIVFSEVETKYNGAPGKTINFNSTTFQSIPSIMIDKYLDLNLFSYSNNFKKDVVYKQTEKWRGKTLTDVKAMSGTILNPTNEFFNNSEYIYSITDSIFSQDDFQYARFFVNVSLIYKGDTVIVDDAKKIYGLNLNKKYTYVDTRWKFAYPSEVDISKFVSNNKSLASELSSNTQSSVVLFAPFVNVSLNEIKNVGAEGIVKRFGTSNDFIAPNSFTYVVMDDDVRKVWFEITSLKLDETNKDIIDINMNLNVGEGKLQASSTIVKKFDTKLYKFV